MQELLDRLPPRQLKLLICAAVAILSAAAFSYLLLPEVRAYRKAQESRAVLEQVAASGDVLEAQLAARHAALEEIRHRLHGDMANLPARQMEAYIIGRLQSISWRNGIELVGVEPAPGGKVQMFREILFKVELMGDYHDLFRWLWEARRELGYVVVKEYKLSRLDPRAAEGKLRAELTMASYKASGS